jgi:hypothetical protein
VLCLDVFRKERRLTGPTQNCAASDGEGILEGIGGGDFVVEIAIVKVETKLG